MLSALDSGEPDFAACLRYSDVTVVGRVHGWPRPTSSPAHAMVGVVGLAGEYAEAVRQTWNERRPRTAHSQSTL
jgi:hypothetical protein